MKSAAEELFDLIYAHTVIKYDPAAGIRCCAAALQAAQHRQEDVEMREALTNWRNNLAITQNSPVVGDALYGPALDFVIEQIDVILARAALDRNHRTEQHD